MTVDALLNNERWTQGPGFLKQLEDAWPLRPADMGEISSDDPEVKKSADVFANEASKESDHIGKYV